MSVQIIKQNGQAAFAVLPYDEYLELIEQLEDEEDMAAVSTFMASDEETYPSEIGDALIDGENPIKVFRRYRKMTQDDLARAIKKSKVYVAKLEAGERQGSTAVIRDIASALRVDIDQLI
jgi:DNA-binding XRE family transcriptional regulator